MIGRLMRRVPVTTVALIAFAILMVGELLYDDAGRPAAPSFVIAAWRVVLVPAYLLSLGSVLVLTAVFGSDAVHAWPIPVVMIARFLPFLLLDLCIAGVRRFAGVVQRGQARRARHA